MNRVTVLGSTFVRGRVKIAFMLRICIRARACASVY